MASFQFFLYRHCLHACTNQPKCGNFLYLILTLPLQASWSWTCYYLLAWKTAPDRSINNKVGTGIIFLLLCFPGFLFLSLHMFYFVSHFHKQKQPNKKKSILQIVSFGSKFIQIIQELNCLKMDMHKIILIIQTLLLIFSTIQRFPPRSTSGIHLDTPLGLPRSNRTQHVDKRRSTIWIKSNQPGYTWFHQVYRAGSTT